MHRPNDIEPPLFESEEAERAQEIAAMAGKMSTNIDAFGMPIVMKVLFNPDDGGIAIGVNAD
jgi:hypothetical protein